MQHCGAETVNFYWILFSFILYYCNCALTENLTRPKPYFNLMPQYVKIKVEYYLIS